ncbi:MAG: RNA polymerase sigma factor [Phycisphaerales bacterium]
MATMSRATERRVIRRCLRGDRGAAESLVRAHQASLFAFMLRMCGKRDLAEDIVQDAFVKALTNLDRFDSQFRFSTWLFTIARRTYYNHLERRSAVRASDEMLEAARGGGETSESELERDDRARLRGDMEQAILELTEVQRTIVLLFYQHDWPVWLVAQHLGLPEGTVKSHLHRARLKLRELLLVDDRAGSGALDGDFVVFPEDCSS